MKAVLITGVSSGIGYGTAKEFAQHGYRVFGSVRKAEDAQRLKADLGANFIPLIFDVTDLPAMRAEAKRVAALLQDQRLVGLINNAGVATSGPLVYQPLDEIRWQFEVNVIAPIAVIQTFLPLLKTKARSPHRSRIINISSVGGKIASPFIGAYAGSKHAIEGLSHSLRRELLLQGIDVIVIGPGAVNTPIWDKESAQDMSRYAATEYAKPIQAFQRYALDLGKRGYSPETVGRLIRNVFESQHPKSRYAFVPNPLLNWVLPLALPDRWLDRIMGRLFGLFPK